MPNLQALGYEDDDDRYLWDDDEPWCGDCGKCENCLESAMDECGMITGGGCRLVGTEHCDWDCPFSDEI